MILQDKTLEKLRKLINEETEYRSGPKLIKFFNDLGFNDIYGQGFPSRWMYTDEKLNKINGTPELDKCIKKLFAPVNFIGRFEDLDKFIKEFNQYLVFDNWKILRDGKAIKFVKSDKIETEIYTSESEINEFLKREFSDISIDKLGIDGAVTQILKLRFIEMQRCLSANAPLSLIFLAGSTLEGILLGMALKYPKEFNLSKMSPKDKEGKIKKFQEWTLNNLIDVSCDLGLLLEDVKKFSHSLRDFRNYIHPYEQVTSKFNPDNNTALICWQVLKAAIFQLNNNQLKIKS